MINEQIEFGINVVVCVFGYEIMEVYLEVVEWCEEEVVGKFVKVGDVLIGEDEIMVIYQYKILEILCGVWIWCLQCFIEDIEIKILEVDGYCYEYLVLGGFLCLELKQDVVYMYCVLKLIDVIYFLEQGYFV